MEQKDTFKDCLEKIVPVLKKHYGERIENYNAAKDLLGLIQEIIHDVYAEL